METRTPGSGVSRGLVGLLALACGLTVANLYYAQPLLATIAHALHTSAGTAGLVVTATQAGYAAGLLLLVPLGDVVALRRLVPGMLGIAALGLVVIAIAPGIGALEAAAVLVGLTSVVAQMLVPFAATLARDGERGSVVGTIMSGLLLGILLARTLSGVVAEVAGWRAVFWMGAALVAVLAVVLARRLPVLSRPSTRPRYADLLRSIVVIAREEPLLRRRSVYGAAIFATFSVLWTSLAFLLSRPPYDYSELAIGAFGLAGAAGATAASVAGRINDRSRSPWPTGFFLAVAVLSWILLALGGHDLAALIVGVVTVDLGVQGTQVTNQSEIYRLRPEARSRLTTVYMTTYFAGGAIGSAISAWAYATDSWAGVCLAGAGFAGVAFLAWLTELPAYRRNRVACPA